MTSTLGLRKPYQIQLPEQAQDIDAMFEQLYRRIADLEARLGEVEDGSGAGGSGPHDILSATHTDTTAHAEVNGDLIAGLSGKWARLPVGINKQVLEVVAGAPAWSNDGSGLEDLNAAELVGTIPAAAMVHSMLSAAHQDSEPASAVLGDMIVAQTGSATDAQANWIDGEALGGIPTSGDAGGGDYWIDGGAWGELITTGTVLWRRKAVGTSGYIWTAGPTGPEWQAGGSASGASSSASAYRSSDYTLADTTPTAVILQAVTFDDGGFWAAGTPTRLTIPVGQGGTYIITGTFALDSGYAGISYAHLYVNGVKKATGPGGGKTATAPYTDPASCTAIIKLNSGDYVELYAEIRNNVVGAGFTVKGGATATFLEIGRLVSESTVSTELPSVAAGAVIRGNSAGTQWERVSIGAANTVLLSSGTLPDWSTRPTLRDVAESITAAFDFTVGLKERSRAHLLGEWVSPAYAAGDYTASGGMTWGVDLADVLTYEYTVIGKTMIVVFALGSTSVTAPLGTDLQLKIPGGYTAAKTAVGGTVRVSDNGSAGELGICVVGGGGTNILIRKGPLIAAANWTASVNNTTVQGIMAFEVT